VLVHQHKVMLVVKTVRVVSLMVAVVVVVQVAQE
jgi:hypothetical protein